MKEFTSTKFWSNIETLMKEKDITSGQLSLAIGSTQSYIGTASRNKGVPNLATALALANYFKTTVEELAYGNIGLETRRKRLLKELEEINNELAGIE